MEASVYEETGRTMRNMELRIGSIVAYSSQFDEKTGSLVRIVEAPRRRYGGFDFEDNEEFKKRYPERWLGAGIFSPVPETVDVSITDRCSFGCVYCYQDSRPRRTHGPKDLVEKIIQGFDQPPYQMAIGGGEPTSHPDFPWILKRSRELGTVPNYTTNGEKLRREVIDATNEFCGGVAMTFHAFKGIDWFIKHYNDLKKALRVQVNVHLIADKDVAKNLSALVHKVSETGPLRLVLLAYYPDVGRASMESLITKRVYMKELPEALQMARSANYNIAFSEGLLPYFLSRPELGINTSFAMRSEGLFSCYFDPKGRISASSFDPPAERKWSPGTVYEKRSQELWETLRSPYGPHGNACYGCQHAVRCATPHSFHYLACAFAEHNKVALKEKYVEGEPIHDRVIDKDIV